VAAAEIQMGHTSNGTGLLLCVVQRKITPIVTNKQFPLQLKMTHIFL
jgi:hypothetical protein